MKDPHQFFAEARHARDQQTQELHENAAFITGINMLARDLGGSLPPVVLKTVVGAVLGGIALPFALDQLSTLSPVIREKALKVGAYLKRKLKGQKASSIQGSLASLKAANTADLKEYPGKRGEQAHKRLHREIGKLLKTKKENP